MTSLTRSQPSDSLAIRANVLTPTGFVDGVVRVAGETTTDVDLLSCRPNPHLPCIIPGFCDIHATGFDFLKAERKGIRPSPVRSLMRHDAALAASGTTWPLTTLSLDNPEGDGRALQAASDALALLCDAQKAHALRVSHDIHLRCELTDDGVAEKACALIELAARSVKLVSFMDHSPGQGQFKAYQKWAGTVSSRLDQDDRRIRALASQRVEASASLFQERAAQVAAAAKAHGVLIASHDLETVEQVRCSDAFGGRICEFPITEAAAYDASVRGHLVIAGAPNLINGGSHVGNISAAQLLRAIPDLALTYDYAPGATIEAWQLLSSNSGPLEATNCTSLRAQSALLSGDAVGLVAGARADLLQFRQSGKFLRIEAVWQLGKRVA